MAHEHDHDRNHAYEHQHDHNHNHGPDCVCGCHDHDHNHEHTHDHEHDHGNSHDHGYVEAFEQEWGSFELEAHMHEQAATVSMNIHPRDGREISFSDLVNVMQSIAQAAENSGGIVGHIKGFARQGDDFAHASVTSADLAPAIEGDKALSFGAEATVQLVAIVLLIDQADLLAICKETLVF